MSMNIEKGTDEQIVAELRRINELLEGIAKNA